MADANHDERESVQGLTPETVYRPAKTRHFLSPKRATGRLLRSTLVGVAISLIWPAPSWPLRLMIGWDAFAFTLLAHAWLILWKSDAATTQQRASDEDPGRFPVFVIAVASSVVSVFAATLVIRITRGQNSNVLWEAIALAAVALSWLVTHTAYTFRYAHLYYKDNEGAPSGGLIFPGTSTPCDMDFAYFSFTLGMAFQVSDVQVDSPDVRRTTFLHALISFGFNTTILALALNVMFTLLGGSGSGSQP